MSSRTHKTIASPRARGAAQAVLRARDELFEHHPGCERTTWSLPSLRRRNSTSLAKGSWRLICRWENLVDVVCNLRERRLGRRSQAVAAMAACSR